MPSNSAVWVSALTLCAGVTALADTKIATKYVADGQTTVTVMYAKGERMRYDYGKGESLLRQCDLKRITQLDDTAKTFLSEPAEQPAADATKPVSQINVMDTTERKDMFGYQARHLRMTETTAGSKGHVETDGWYIDLKDLPSCSMAAPAKADAPSPGFPAAYTITTYADNGKAPTVFSMQITDLTVAPLDAALFEIPAAYKEAGKAAERPAVAKTAGMVRVGSVPLRNHSEHKNVSTAPFGHLLSQLQDAQIDVLPLAEGTDDAIKEKAAQAQCDYILYTDLISVDKPAMGKVGGLLHKTPIVGKATDGDAYEARVDYRLMPLAEGAPVLNSSAIAKKGHSFNWVGAAMLASNFIPMTMAAKMLGGPGGLNPAMLNALLKGGAPGSAMTSMDPMMGGMSMFLHAANLGGPAANEPANTANVDPAVAAALDMQSQALITYLKK